MQKPEVSATTPVHEAERRRFYRRLFRWGVVLSLAAWLFSILVSQSLLVDLKGWNGMRFSIEGGSVVLFISDGTCASSHIRMDRPSYLWSAHRIKELRKYPGGFIENLSRVGWKRDEYFRSQAIALPVAGFLWLWLIGGWMGGFKRIRFAEFAQNGGMILRATILISLPALVLLADHRWRIARERAGCVLNVRSIQQAMRGHSGVSGLNIGQPVHWSDLIGHGKYLPEQFKNCPCGHSYRFKSYSTALGELFAECPNPDHQQRLVEMGTSEW